MPTEKKNNVSPLTIIVVVQLVAAALFDAKHVQLPLWCRDTSLMISEETKSVIGTIWISGEVSFKRRPFLYHVRDIGGSPAITEQMTELLIPSSKSSEKANLLILGAAKCKKKTHYHKKGKVKVSFKKKSTVIYSFKVIILK